MKCNDQSIRQLAQDLGARLLTRGLRVATAESCTGGGIAYYLTSVSGSSAWFNYGWVTYSEQAKVDLLGVSPEMIQTEHVVSAAVAQAMAVGALAKSQADVAVSVTGVAGPGGGSALIPVGTVYLAWQWREQVSLVERYQFQGDRQAIRLQSIHTAIVKLIEQIG